MTDPLRVLVVDDSVVVRRLVGDALANEPGITAGTASDGRIALAKIAASPPDLVILDIEMPELDGLATLAAIRKGNPNLPVVMFSTLTQRAAAATIEALTLGASDYVTKPEGHGSLDVAREVIRSQLVPKIRALCKRGGAPAARPRTSSAVPVMPAAAMRAGTMHLPNGTGVGTGLGGAAGPRTGTVRLPAVGAAGAFAGGPARVVAIGISTGGPPALQTLLAALPRLPVPVLIVQHMPPDFTAMLAKRLSAVTPHTVTEAVDGAAIGPGQVWIAKGDHHLRVEAAGDGAVLRLDGRGAPENSCRPAVDVLFRSVSELYGARTLGVVMTGMGQDGLRGAEVIRRGKGQVVIQDEASSVVWGMPGAVARAGQCDAVLPLAQLARELVRRTAAVGGAS